MLSGLGAIEYTGRSIFSASRRTAPLITEYALDGQPRRSFGELRRTGHESDRNVHLALNSGLVVANPAGGFYFVFLAGVPLFRKYDDGGRLVFERHIEDVELDRFMQTLPTTWKRRRPRTARFPLVLPSVLAAAADRRGNLWISTAVGVTYVYDAQRRQAAGGAVPRGRHARADRDVVHASGGARHARLLRVRAPRTVTPSPSGSRASSIGERRLAGEEARGSWQDTVLAAPHARTLPRRC